MFGKNSKNKKEELKIKNQQQNPSESSDEKRELTEQERNMRMKFEKAKDFKGTFKKLLVYLHDFRLHIFGMMIFSVLSVIFAILGPKIMGRAITKIYEGLIGKIQGNPNAFDFTGIRNILLLLLCLYILSSIFIYITNYLVSKAAQGITYRMRNELSAKLNRLPLKYFDTKTNGEILSRVVNDVDNVSMTLNQSIGQIITAIVTLFGVIAMMLSISWKMTMAVLIIMPITGILVALVVRKSQVFFKSNSAAIGRVNSHVEEAFSGFTILKAFNGEEQSINKFDLINTDLYESAWKSQFASSVMMPMMNFVGNIGYVLIAIYGGYLAANGSIQIGDIVSFTQYIRQLGQPLAQVAQVSSILQSTMASAERIFEVLEEVESPDNGKRVLRSEDVKGNIEFKNVRFGYNDDKIIIKDFSCNVKAGMNVAIVGPTGAGKTTLVKLLMRFYDLNSGEILLDGVNINEYTKDSLRKSFGMVLQDTWLFNGTIMENIRYGNLKATDEEVKVAARTAHAEHFILTQPKGYEMEINEESNNISQGQKQLLTIARAVASDPKVMILDEATSSVDTRLEHLIQEGMKNLSNGRTSFIIAHRLSTIVDADLILVINDGDIVEQGTHEELLKFNGFYADLYKSQFEL